MITCSITYINHILYPPWGQYHHMNSTSQHTRLSTPIQPFHHGYNTNKQEVNEIQSESFTSHQGISSITLRNRFQATGMPHGINYKLLELVPSLCESIMLFVGNDYICLVGIGYAIMRINYCLCWMHDGIGFISRESVPLLH